MPIIYSKPFSVRLPLPVAARLAAYSELNPETTRTDHVVFLLMLALEGFELCLSVQRRQEFLRVVERRMLDLSSPSA